MGMLRSVKCFNVAKKSTKAESTLRTQEVYSLLTQAYTRQEILQHCSIWQVSDRQVDTYIARAREMLDADCAMSRPAFLAELMARLRGYEKQAARRGQLQVAVNAATQQARLVGLDT